MITTAPNRKARSLVLLPGLALLLTLPACSMGDAKAGSTSARAAVERVSAVKPDCCAAKEKKKPGQPQLKTADGLTIPDVVLLDQDGRRVRFYSDLIEGRKVVVNYFFTSCTTICPLLTATMAQVQELLLKQGRDDIRLVSISVDPVTDTPPRLKAWCRNFDTKPGWTFVTGEKLTVDRLLKSLKSFTPDPQDHSPMILIGNEPAQAWKLVNGLSPAGDLVRAICDGVGPKAATAPAPGAVPPRARKENPGAKKYFTDVELIDQNGRSHRLYSDLMQGRVLVIDSFFSSCTGVCPALNRQIKEIYKAFGDRMGKDLFVLSISVDPTVDTPQRLRQYAEDLKVGPGWYFLSGPRENVETALRKFGMYVESREDHSNLFLIGNDASGLWKKAFGLAPAEELIDIVDSVLNDREGVSN